MTAKPYKMTDPSEPMRLLEKLLKASWNPRLKSAKPIVFDLVLEQWTLDPASTRGLISKGAIADAPLTVHTTAETLLRALSDPSYSIGDFEVATSGDVSALSPIIDALSAKQSAIAVRMNRGF